MKQFFKVLYVRLTSETPKFFKWIVRVGLICSALGGGLKAVSSSIPTSIDNFAGYLVAAGIATTVVGNFAIRDTPEIKEKLQETETK